MRVTLIEVLAFFGNKSAIIAADCEFIESLRSLDLDGTLIIEFWNLNGVTRSISFEAHYVKFQGTTYRDLKWATDYKNFKELLLRQPKAGSIAGILELVWSGGGSKRIGWISKECWKQLQEVTRDIISSRTQVDA